MMREDSYTTTDCPDCAGGFLRSVLKSGIRLIHRVLCQPIAGDVSCVRSYAHTPPK